MERNPGGCLLNKHGNGGECIEPPSNWEAREKRGEANLATSGFGNSACFSGGRRSLGTASDNARLPPFPIRLDLEDEHRYGTTIRECYHWHTINAPTRKSKCPG